MAFTIGATFDDSLADEVKWLAVLWGIQNGTVEEGSVPNDFTNQQAQNFLNARVKEFLLTKHKSFKNNEIVGAAVEAAHVTADAAHDAVADLIS